MPEEDNLIKAGDYVVIQRQSYIKLHKLKVNGTVTLGKDQVEMENVIGKPYYSTFRMIVRPKNKRVYSLEVSEHVQSIKNVNIEKSGTDNRDIIDDGSSQKLSIEEITKFRDEALSSSDIVEKLITNSKTFCAKTEYSQEKYLKKKEKKYFEYIQVRRPTLRLIADIYYKLDPGKVQGIRIDDLSQILTYANIQTDSSILLYDSGTSGLLAAAVTNTFGKNTNSTLIHMHPGNVSQKEAFVALQFPSEQSERCINVCLYSVLRCFYQEFSAYNLKLENDSEFTKDDDSEKNTKTQIVKEEQDTVETVEITEEKITGIKRKHSIDLSENKVLKRPCWQIENERACKILANKVDSLIIVAKEHPGNIVKELLTFLNYGRPFVIFSLLRETLQNVYVELKNDTSYIALNLSNNLLRNYQVLQNRTHPDVNMTCGGYILTGFKVNSKADD